MRRFFFSDSGQTIVEVAVVAPLLFVLLAGAIGVGRSAPLDMRFASAARAGAQYGSQNLVTADDSSGMQTAGTNDGHSWTGLTVAGSPFCKCADGSNTSCTANACSSNHRLVYVTVTATASFRPMFNYFFGATQPRSKTVVLQVAQ